VKVKAMLVLSLSSFKSIKEKVSEREGEEGKLAEKRNKIDPPGRERYKEMQQQMK